MYTKRQLKQMFEPKKEVAVITRPALSAVEPYDGALDAFERGMRSSRLDDIFSELRSGLVPLLEAIMEPLFYNPNLGGNFGAAKLPTSARPNCEQVYRSGSRRQ